MNLKPRTTGFEIGKNILYNTIGYATKNITLDSKKFKPGVIEAGLALIKNTDGKFEPYKDGAVTESEGAIISSPEVAILANDVKMIDDDVIGVGIIGGYVIAERVTGLTKDFANMAKMIDFKTVKQD